MQNKTAAVFGAYGHTAQFIISRLLQGGWRLSLCGRNAAKLAELEKKFHGVTTRVVDINNPGVLDQALSDVNIVINCAGPFIETAIPLVEAALRSSIHYIDISAEQKSVSNVFESFSKEASSENVLILPGLGFFGGLSELLTSAAMSSWDYADEISICIGLSSWEPTAGTRKTGQRNHYPKVILKNGRLEPKQTDALPLTWNFPAPLGVQKMIDLPFSEVVLIERLNKVRTLTTYISRNAFEDLRNSSTPPPRPVDRLGRSAQQFCVDVTARAGGQQSFVRATGQDIYAVTAPLIAEAAERIILKKLNASGVVTPSQAFDAKDLLSSLSPAGIQVFFEATVLKPAC